MIGDKCIAHTKPDCTLSCSVSKSVHFVWMKASTNYFLIIIIIIIIITIPDITLHFDSLWHPGNDLPGSKKIIILIIKSGDWLFALPVSSCELKLHDEAVRVAVGMRLGMNMCAPRLCRCGAQVDACGTHSLVCKQAPGRGTRHHVLTDVVARAFATAGFSVLKKPAGLSRVDGKRPDGMTLVPWQAGKPVVLDLTVICITANSYVEASARESGAAAEIAATRKEAKYSSLPTQYTFHPIVIETHGPLNETALDIFCELSRHITALKHLSCSNCFQFACSDLTQFTYTTVFPWINRIYLHFSYFCISYIFEKPGTLSRD